MEVQYEKTGPCNGKLEVTVPAEDVNKAFDKVYKQFQKSAKIPGFRPGKAPQNILEMHYGSAVKSEVESILVGDSLRDAIIENKIDTIARPQVELGQLKKGSAFSYSAALELRPEIELQSYKELKIKEVVAEVADEDVDNELQRLREQSAQMVPVMVRDEVQKGDHVLLDYAGTIDGEPFDGGSAQNAMIEVGGDQYLAEFSGALEGLKVPITVQVPVTFPDDYGAEQLRGKKAVFEMQAKEIKTKELPNLDDEFAADLGEESLDALKSKIQERMLTGKKTEADNEQRQQMLKALVEINPFEVPESMVLSQSDRIIAGAAAQIQQMTGQKFPIADMDLDGLRAENRENAEFQVRSGLLLLEVAKAEELEVADADIDAHIQGILQGAGEHGERIAAFYRAPEERDRLRYKLLEDKTIQFLLESAVKEKS